MRPAIAAIRGHRGLGVSFFIPCLMGAALAVVGLAAPVAAGISRDSGAQPESEPFVGAGSGGGGSSSSSNASNYHKGAQLSVNPRTGAVSLQAGLVEIPGVVAGISFALTLSYRSEDAVSNSESGTQYFGLPYGWWFNISFINNNGSYTELRADGTQTYALDANWRTLFTLAGSETPVSVNTGLQQYNRADANLRSDQPAIVVGGISSHYVFSNLGGMSKYFSANGLLLQETDRFGNSIQYFYDRDANAREARFASIVDSWGNTTTFGYCEDSSCTAGEVTITLPDGRTVGWIAPNAQVLTDIIDSEGKRTHLGWEQSPCERGQNVVSGLTSPSGGMTALLYGCLDVCTQPSQASCSDDGNVTTWPVVETVYECPNNTSGQKCPAGSPSDYMTTQHTFSTATNPNNYTGYPLYSPYVPADPGDPEADSLMQSNNFSFTYSSTSAKLSASGTVIYEATTDYNFLHLNTEERVSVRARQSSGSFALSLSKETSYCYSVSAGGEACPLTNANYETLPANYQMPTITGSCVYDVSDSDTDGARRSIGTTAFDGFGLTVNKKLFHGSGAVGVVSTCDRSTRLSTAGMRLVADSYMQYDTPASATKGFFELGTDAAQFGLLTGELNFLYLEEDQSGTNAHAPIASTSGPVLVKLTCHTLTEDSGAEKAGTSIKATISGLLPNSSAPPQAVGLIEHCASPDWNAGVAPPKTTTFEHDQQGRAISHLSAWAEGFTSPGGVDSTSGSVAYSSAGTAEGEEACGDGQGANILKIETTDALGNVTSNRICTLNGFHLSNTDAGGRTSLVEHSPTGLTTKQTNPNGTFTATSYHYACPIAQDGRSRTCPTDATPCPYDEASQARSCSVETVNAGSNPTTGEPQQSHLDGVMRVAIKDGLGRAVMTRDNLAPQSSGTGVLQTRSEQTYNSLGLVSESTEQVGASAPIVYRTTTKFDEKLRPSTVCTARGESHQFVHDDVAQMKRLITNGHTREVYTLNDSRQLTAISNCELVTGSTTGGSGCPVVAADTNAVECPANAYLTDVLHDGAGQIHSTTASAGDEIDPGASVSSVNGFTTFSADMLKYAYSYTSGANDNAVTASSSWVRDLQGQLIRQDLSVSSDSGDDTTSTDTYDFNEIAHKTAEHNKLGGGLTETYDYTSTGRLRNNVSYEGVEFHHYHDDLDRQIRFCHESESGGSEGESFTLDPISGANLTVRHFTNPSACSDCGQAVCPGDVPGDAVHYSYNRFNAIDSIVYEDGSGAELQWAYDKYQRLTCVADALATSSGGGCPQTPTEDDFRPDPEDLVVSYRYWPDGDPYRRGLRQSICRGVLGGDGSYATHCIDTDYYTPVDAGGSCVSGLDGVIGAYSGQIKSRTYCRGGGCVDGTGTPVYQTKYLYDAHRRLCSVESRESDGDLIRGSAYTYDQYDQLVSETHSSDLEPTHASNYRLDNVYDGLLRLVEQTRTSSEGDLIERLSYQYDAASNLIEKVREASVGGFPPGPDPTPTGERTVPATEVLTPTAVVTVTVATTSTAVRSSTPVPTEIGGDDDSCQIQAAGGWSWWLAVPALFLAVVGRCRGNDRRVAPPSEFRRPGGKTTTREKVTCA